MASFTRLLAAVCDVDPVQQGKTDMLAPILWIFAIGGSIGVMLVTAAAEMHGVHLLLATLIASGIAACGIRDVVTSDEQQSDVTGRAAIITRYMSVMWGWSAVSVLAIYDLVLQWDGWYVAFLLLALAAILCSFVSSILRREAQTPDGDVRLVGLVNVVARSQFVLACLVLGALLGGGRFVNEFSSAAAWAGINLCVSSAMGFAVLTGFVIATCPQPSGLTAVGGDNHARIADAASGEPAHG
jgi:hypothetical protein